MSDPKWLSRSEVERIYTKLIEATGGSHGLRDVGLLESALARNHAFVDGNKRIAFQSAHFFLRKNGQDLQPSKGNKHASMIENLAQGKISREDAARYFKDNSRTIRKQNEYFR